MKNFNQELSIAARKEFAKGNVDKAWKMALESESFSKEITKEQWIRWEEKCLITSIVEEARNKIINEQLSKVD